MEALRIENLSFRYALGDDFALRNINLSVEKGEFVTIIGPSGSGKTTLLRQLKPAIAPFGTLTGDISFSGKPLSALSAREQCGKIGFVFQSPDDQLVTDKVWHELAFALEGLGLPNDEIRLRVAETAAFFGIEGLFRRDVSTLSGGEKQLVSLAAVMAARPEMIVLDEPTGQLDPLAASEFLSVLKRVSLELGTTVILSEHRTEEAVPLSDKLIVLDGGRLLASGSPRETAAMLLDRGSRLFAALPTPTRVWAAVNTSPPCPVSVREGRSWLEKLSESRALMPLPEGRAERDGKTAIELNEVFFRYSRQGAEVLRGLTCGVRRGEILALLGGNGAGKSTALSVMAGILKPYRGKVRRGQKTALLPQDPRILFLRPTVGEDLRDAIGQTSLAAEEKSRLIEETVALCGLEELLFSHPYDLSGGQIQMAALAKLLLSGPDVFLLDEPTKGLDAISKARLEKNLKKLCEDGKTVVMASHDVEFCAHCADRCAMLFDGELIGAAAPREFFSDKSFYTTATHRMSRGIVEGAVLPEELILACGGVEPVGKPPDTGALPPPEEAAAVTPESSGGGESGPELFGAVRKRVAPRALFTALFLAALIPPTVYFGLRYFGERSVYLVSLLVILEAMLPFFIVYEGRRPRARELVLLAVLCGLAVCGRLAFYMLPQVKPALALVIIAGACFGGETGFIVGALSAFISNFFFGQGPWTPWQMFATGLTGLFAGMIFSKSALPGKKLSLCAYGFFACVVLYGGIMNPASVLITQANPTPELFAAALLMGLPFDLVQGAATVVFLRLLAPVMGEKLGRIRVKYGLFRF